MNMPILTMLMLASDARNVLKPALIKPLLNYPATTIPKGKNQLHNRI
jgi:hypothetical protein